MASPLFLLPLLRRYIVQTKSYTNSRWQEYTSFAILNLAERTAQDLAAKNSQVQEVRIFNQITGQPVRVYKTTRSS